MTERLRFAEGRGWAEHSRRDDGDGRRRRIWPNALRAAIVAESFAAGANVSHVAAQHDVNACMLCKWRRQAVAQGSVGALRSPTTPLGFVTLK
jgi:transposase-like protein